MNNMDSQVKLSKIINLIFFVLFFLIITNKLNMSLKNLINSKKSQSSMLSLLEIFPDKNYDLVYSELLLIKDRISSNDNIVCMKNKSYDHFSLSYPLSPYILKPCSIKFNKNDKVLIFKIYIQEFKLLSYKTDVVYEGEIVSLYNIKE
jgi:hypothetical protein